jgi:hypothetical protein
MSWQLTVAARAAASRGTCRCVRTRVAVKDGWLLVLQETHVGLAKADCGVVAFELNGTLLVSSMAVNLPALLKGVKQLACTHTARPESHTAHAGWQPNR